MPLYVVETISTFRTKYVIECNNRFDALDVVAMEEAPEFSQMHLGEQIITAKEITRDDFHIMNDALNVFGDGTSYQPESGSPWMGERAIHVVDYGKE